MADIGVNFSVAVKRRAGATPVIPPNAQDEPTNPVNPFPNDSGGNFVTLDTDQTITGQKTFNSRVRITDNEISISNWVTSSGSYDKLSVNFGESRGIGYDPYQNEIFIKGATTNVPFKIDTDAPSDSLQILDSGGLKASNIPSGTPISNLGLDVNNNVVTSSAIIQSSGTWTPTLSNSGDSGDLSYTFTTTTASYTRMGNFVYFTVELTSINSSGTGIGVLTFKVGGLPLAPVSWSTASQSSVVLSHFGGSNLSATLVQDLVPVNATAGGIAFRDKKNGAISRTVTFSSGSIRMSGYYTTN